jgi:hypothetical protein
VPDVNGECIVNFLGDVSNRPEILASKLNNDEKVSLDSDLNIDEFDKAIAQAKTNSSPGLDGISNKFIKKFWRFFRVPLFNDSTYCLNNGNLTESFRVAKIRLIPKKRIRKK